MEDSNIQAAILISSFAFFLVLNIIIVLFYIFQKKKIAFLLNERAQERKFEKTLITSQVEIKENTLKGIAWELHDNVGQLLSLARLELNILLAQNSENNEKLEEISNIVGKSLEEIRALSKTLNQEVVHSIGIENAIQIEVDRLNRLKFINCQFKIIGNTKNISTKDEIILFRIVQEFINNTIKHSKATQLHIQLEYLTDKLFIKLKDNGIGFNNKNIQTGSGLINMKSRAELIKTQLSFTSDISGTQLKLSYPIIN